MLAADAWARRFCEMVFLLVTHLGFETTSVDVAVTVTGALTVTGEKDDSIYRVSRSSSVGSRRAGIL